MKADRYVSTGVPVIRGGNIGDGRALTGDFVFVAEETADELRSSNLFGGELVFPHRGAIGQVALVPRDRARYMLSTSLMKLTCDPDLVDASYLYYYFRSAEGRQALLRNASTVGTPGIGQPLASLRSVLVPLPPLDVQRRIAEILGELDDKSELNRRLSETLDAAARLLFKSWFIDFSAVRVKAEGRVPDMPPGLTDLFPRAFADSKIGGIPEGWRVAELGDETTTLLGGTPARDNPSYWGGDIPWINSGKANDFRVVEPSDFISQAGLDSSASKLLPARTIIIAITGATLGQVSLTEIDTCANQSIVGVLGSEAMPSEYLYYWVKERVGDLVAAQTGGSARRTRGTRSIRSGRIPRCSGGTSCPPSRACHCRSWRGGPDSRLATAGSSGAALKFRMSAGGRSLHATEHRCDPVMRGDWSMMR